MDDSSIDSTIITLQPPGFLPDDIQLTTFDSRQYAAFGELSRPFADGLLTALAGVRYFRDNREQGGTAVAGRLDETFTATSPRFNLSLTPSERTTYYLNIANGFRSGGFNNPQTVQIAQSIGYPLEVIVPESEVWSYEIGARFTWLDQRLLLESSVYWADYDDYQMELVIAGFNEQSDLVAKVEVRGADITLTYLPTDGLTVSAMGSVNQTEPTKLDPAAVLVSATPEDGEQLPNVPKWEYRLGVDYQRPLASGWNAFASAAYYERAKQKDIALPLSSAKIQDLSLRFGLGNERWTITAWGTNLTDEKGPASTITGAFARYDRRILGLTVEAVFQ